MQPIVTPDPIKDGKSVLNKNNDSDSGSDDCLVLDVSVFKKPKLQPEPQKNTEMQLKVSNPFTDKDKKECVLVTMKTNFYTLKANGITSVLKTFFESILQGKKEQKRLFGGCWVAKERKEAFSKVSEVKMQKGYAQYVAVLKVFLYELDVAAAVSSIFYLICLFMKNKQFPKCYRASMEDIFGSESKLIKKLDEATWKIFENIDMQFTYTVPMDALVHDEDIYQIMKIVTGVDRDTMFQCEDLKGAMFKNSEEKRFNLF